MLSCNDAKVVNRQAEKGHLDCLVMPRGEFAKKKPLTDKDLLSIRPPSEHKGPRS